MSAPAKSRRPRHWRDRFAAMPRRAKFPSAYWRDCFAKFPPPADTTPMHRCRECRVLYPFMYVSLGGRCEDCRVGGMTRRQLGALPASASIRAIELLAIDGRRLKTRRTHHGKPRKGPRDRTPAEFRKTDPSRWWPAAILARFPEAFGKVLSKLSASERRLFKLYFGQQLDTASVAAATGRTQAAIYTGVHRLRQQFKLAGLPPPRHPSDVLATNLRSLAS